jgi:predicted enzyme related to lactoylglutathione lyase
VSTLLVNVDVDDLDTATRFYCAACELRVGRRFDGAAELLGASAPIYLLSKAPGTRATPVSDEKRRYGRHWTPVHLDFVVENVEQALVRAKAAGATAESGIESHAWGRLALLADPFGNGFCLLQFTGRGYDEIAKRIAT